MKRNTKRTLKTIALGLLGLLVVGGVVAGISSLVSKQDDEFKTIHPSFEIGSLNENGKYVESKGSLYTKEAIEINKGDEIKFTLDFDGNIEYQLFYYNGNDVFESRTDVMNVNFTHIAENDGCRIRVLVTPIWDEDVDVEKRTINLFTMSKYTSQLTIEFKEYEPLPVTCVVREQVGQNEYKDVFTFEYKEGMTWREWLESDYSNNFETLLGTEENMHTDGYLKFVNENKWIPIGTLDSVIDNTYNVHIGITV